MREGKGYMLGEGDIFAANVNAKIKVSLLISYYGDLGPAIFSTGVKPFQLFSIVLGLENIYSALC